jgi:L-aspartate semialdehyde sulfurtransferase ferredoxin
MPKFRYMFTFPPVQMKEPIIYNLGHKFRVITNIRRAEVTEDHGWAILELEGADEDIEAGLDYLRSIGVQVNAMEGDVVTG